MAIPPPSQFFLNEYAAPHTLLFHLGVMSVQKAVQSVLLHEPISVC